MSRRLQMWIKRKVGRSLTHAFTSVPTSAPLVLFTGAILANAGSNEIPVPQRPPEAASGSAIAAQIRELSLEQRERVISAELAKGNIPDFLRRFVPVEMSGRVGNRDRVVTVFVAPDYLAVGSDADYFLTPLSPMAAQSIADATGCVLPTTRLVDAIHAAAPVKLEPIRIPPSEAMTSVLVFEEHNTAVHAQRAEFLESHPLGTLVAGDKKDVVITRRLRGVPGHVAIYGWHDRAGDPIQPLYVGHRATWVDYSHGIRLVHREALLDGVRTSLATILRDSELAPILSEEGPLDELRALSAPAEEATSESVTELKLEPDVRIAIRAPSPDAFDSAKPVRLVFYALPNGNTIEQTWGRRYVADAGIDWHYDIQHIAAQTRWLRSRMTDANLVVACVECANRSWPAWRNKHGDLRIAEIVEELRKRFASFEVKLVLSGHSGGGSFVFGYLNAHDTIPMEVERIAFLDSNYGYLPERGHAAKLIEWLKASSEHYLAVLAYRDDVVRLNGKPIVSAENGTWGRSKMMEKDLSEAFPFSVTTDGVLQRHIALDGRIAILLHPNPEAKVLHTRLVEWNGFIHTLLTGTRNEEQEYKYLGPRVYGRWVADE